jgi:hypothetical protein
MIIDSFIFYNELKLLDFRLNYLKDQVDWFVICEATKTFSGNPKPIFFYDFQKKYFKTYDELKNKIIHLIVDFPIYLNETWARETFQRNYIYNGILQINPNDNDIIILSDVDEIPKIEILKNKFFDEIYSIEMELYYYNLECRSKIKWSLPKIFPFQYLYHDLNNLRLMNTSKKVTNGGWHLSFFGDIDFIKNKIESFSHQEFNTDFYKNESTLNDLIKNNQDLFRRNEVLFEYIPYKDNNNLPLNYEKLL